MLAEFIIRRFSQYKSGASVGAGSRQTFLESLAVSQVEPPNFEMTRAGLAFDVGFGAVTGIAPVQAIPTTAAQWLLYNSSKTKVCAFDELGFALVSGTAAAGAVLYGALCGQGILPATVPTSNAAAIGTNPRHDGSTKPGKSSGLVIASAQTLAAAPTNGWRELAVYSGSGTTILSVAAMARFDGSLIIPPGQGLALWVGSGAGTTPLFAPQGTYREFDTDLEQ